MKYEISIGEIMESGGIDGRYRQDVETSASIAAIVAAINKVLVEEQQIEKMGGSWPGKYPRSQHDPLGMTPVPTKEQENHRIEREERDDPTVQSTYEPIKETKERTARIKKAWRDSVEEEAAQRKFRGGVAPEREKSLAEQFPEWYAAVSAEKAAKKEEQ